MKWQLIIVGVIALPILALFGGIGFLAYQIGENWDARTTDTLIAGMVATCSGGAVVAAMLLALFIGIPFAIRMFGEAGASRRAWREPGSLSPFEPSVGRRPPMIDGNWQSVPAQPATPPWGITGGGNSRLLPTPQQDNRFRLTKQDREWMSNGDDGM